MKFEFTDRMLSINLTGQEYVNIKYFEFFNEIETYEFHIYILYDFYFIKIKRYGEKDSLNSNFNISYVIQKLYEMFREEKLYVISLYSKDDMEAFKLNREILKL